MDGKRRKCTSQNRKYDEGRRSVLRDYWDQKQATLQAHSIPTYLMAA